VKRAEGLGFPSSFRMFLRRSQKILLGGQHHEITPGYCG
jgi:hypothetical protein